MSELLRFSQAILYMISAGAITVGFMCWYISVRTRFEAWGDGRGWMNSGTRYLEQGGIGIVSAGAALYISLYLTSV